MYCGVVFRVSSSPAVNISSSTTSWVKNVCYDVAFAEIRKLITTCLCFYDGIFLVFDEALMTLNEYIEKSGWNLQPYPR